MRALGEEIFSRGETPFNVRCAHPKRMARPAVQQVGRVWDASVTPDELARLATLEPPPRVHGPRYHGIFAPHSTVRERAVPAPESVAPVVIAPAPTNPAGVGEKPEGPKRATKTARTPQFPGRPRSPKTAWRSRCRSRCRRFDRAPIRRSPSTSADWQARRRFRPLMVEASSCPHLALWLHRYLRRRRPARRCSRCTTGGRPCHSSQSPRPHDEEQIAYGRSGRPRWRLPRSTHRPAELERSSDSSFRSGSDTHPPGSAS